MSYCDGMCPCDATGICASCERKNNRDSRPVTRPIASTEYSGRAEKAQDDLDEIARRIARERLEIVCPACDGKREVMSGYDQPEAVTCWTCEGKGTLTGRAVGAATPSAQDEALRLIEEDIWDATPSAQDEEHCCNDPSHMSPEYLAAIEAEHAATAQDEKCDA